MHGTERRGKGNKKEEETGFFLLKNSRIFYCKLKRMGML